MFDCAKDKKFWENVRVSPDFEKHREDIRARYEDVFSSPIRPVTIDIANNTTSDPDFERRFFGLYTSAITALIYPDDDVAFKRLCELCWSYCDMYFWGAQGHFNDYYHRTVHDYDPGLIDIYAASIGMALTEIKHLFADRFPSLLTKRLTAEIRRHIIEPYRTRHYFWEHHDNNWASVCAGGVGCVLLYEDPELFNEEEDRLRTTMKSYLDSYADDGVCVEGSGYWCFGFGFFVSYALLLKEYNGYDYFKDEKVKAISQFLQKLFLDRHTLVTFNDVNPTEGYWIGLPHLLRDVYGDAIDKLPTDFATLTVYQHFAFMLRSFVYYRPEYVSHEALRPATYLMPETGWFTKRTPIYGFAIKGGNNGESHNHIDVGNFILSHNDKQIICDTGAGRYVAGYHGPQRYTFFSPSAYAHNLPIFDGIPEDKEKNGQVTVSYDETANRASIEFAQAYNRDEVKKIDRSFVFGEANVVMHDEFDYDGDVIVERFVSKIKPEIRDGKVYLEDVTLEASDGILPSVSIRQHMDHRATVTVAPDGTRTVTETTTDIYCMDYELPRGKRAFTLEMRIG